MNIKSIELMYDYLCKIHNSFQSIYNIITEFQKELNMLLNELNFRPISEQLIDSYNRMLLFMHDRIKGILSITLMTETMSEIQVIKPVKKDKCYHALEITYQTEECAVSKPLGDVANISINKFEDQIIFLRCQKVFPFIFFNLQICITNQQFREHIEKYIMITKEIIGWLYSDLKSIKVSIKALINIILELINTSNAKENNKWIILLEKITENIKKINS